ncbi:MAG: hypothetical protein K2H60_09455, partial [Muribaculaceae bacterium]|nr:hypothetical protein [Muribaculaceae bacterium]
TGIKAPALIFYPAGVKILGFLSKFVPHTSNPRHYSNDCVYEIFSDYFYTGSVADFLMLPSSFAGVGYVVVYGGEYYRLSGLCFVGA